MKSICLSILLLCSSLAFAQKKVIYDVSFPNAVHHEAEISVTFPDVAAEVLEARMSRSSPGRYAIHEFGKNIYNVKAFNGNGKPLRITRPDPYQWNVHGHNGTVKVTYTLYGDRAGGTYTGIDETHAHMNMPATFMWARNFHNRPIEITFNVREDLGWKVATQLKHENGNRYSAPNLQYFLDSPTEISDYTMREWEVDGQKIQLVVHHNGTEAEVDSYMDAVKKVVLEQKAIYGELPKFDYGTYTFLADYLPWVSGDGMEHRNSTILASTAPLSRSALRLLGTASHEFFHAWNVERIRPKSLEPFNFERANMSGELWFAEGFTSYYGPLTIRRAGLTTDAEYAQGRGGSINTVVNNPGRKFFSPVEMSYQAPFVDAARSIDPQNRANTFISYYTYGNAIGLGLDLTLRSQFPGKTLDGYMQEVWKAHGKNEKSYTVSNLETILAGYTNKNFAADFFNKYVRGKEVVDYKSLLANAGFLLKKTNVGEATLGRAPIQKVRNRIAVSGATIIGTPFYDAGLDRGDVIISLDGTLIAELSDIQEVYDRHKPGDTIKITFLQRGKTKTKDITFIEDPTLGVVTYESEEMEVTDEMRSFRKAWLESKATNK